MRKLLVILLILLTGVANARILHVGDNSIKLSQTKTTNPALHVRVGDEVWYGMMVPTFVKNTLHVRYNNMEYSVLQCAPFTDTTNYTYDESGRLIGANENIYLESTGTQWIDTGLYGDQDSSAKVSVQVYDNGNYHSLIFGSRRSWNSHAFYFDGAYNDGRHWFFNYGGTYNPQSTPYLNDWQKHEIYFNKNKVYMDDELYWESSYTNEFETPGTMRLFDCHNLTSYPNAGPLKGRIWYAMVWDDDTLVRHFVPVPIGLKIGDFVVPENGMWDIVEQKFYGNMGTGEFIYGVDE